MANDTPYGLRAGVWTRDLDRAQRLGRRIESGSLFVNAVVASDPRLPFGGVQRSGYGRELAAPGHPRVHQRPRLLGPAGRRAPAGHPERMMLGAALSGIG
ncbi:MAG TPA: aldehyde dehydrogenase family protein [Actinomycetota bacterium]|nr:aldehyde dehydrogenase family protein [Actinomycetota bacterium]